MIKNLSHKELQQLDSLRSFVIKEIQKKISDFDGDLSEVHRYIKNNSLNKIRLTLFNSLNNKLNWEQIVLSLCGDEIRKKHGSDLLIQSKINLSIQIPNDETSLLPMHTDCNSADTPFQTNVWIPLTNCFKTNSMFLFNESTSRKIMQKILRNKKLENISDTKLDKSLLKLNYGQILLFNPALMHGNKVNKTKKTRISLNVRIKSLFAPEPGDRNPDRKLGTYYKILELSEDTKYGIDLIKKGFFN